MIAAALLAIAADAIIGAVAGSLAEDLVNRLKGDPVKNAFKQALGGAIQRYATGERLALARPLLEKNGLLSDPTVASELSQILSFQREPDTQIIGAAWKARVENPPQYRDFMEEARLLVGYLEDELRRNELFRPAMEAKSLASIASTSERAATSLANIEVELSGLADLLDARFGELAAAFSRSSHGIRDQIRDQSRFITEKTLGFVGRQWLFDETEAFMSANPRGTFFVLGEPGIGKSSLAAQLVKQSGAVHHFNIRAEGVNKAATFLKNICAQLIATYGLDHAVIPPEATDDSGFVNKLLGEVSEKLGAGQRCLIVVDALDEVDMMGMPPGANPLYLPLSLPERVYMVITSRPPSGSSTDVPKPRVDGPQQERRIEHDSTHNLQDVADYLRASAARPGIQDYLTAQSLDAEQFVEMMVAKSGGNFMYLRYVLPEIESGAYRDTDLNAIPVGLQNYYEDHWRRMRGLDEDAWFDYKLPVLVALTVIKEPVSVDLIKDFSKVEDRRQIRRVLSEWSPFLHDEEVPLDGGTQRRYRLYHASFFDFISRKQEVSEERVDLKAMHGQIADTLWDDLFGEG